MGERARVALGGIDENGYHLHPRSKCCDRGVVYLHPEVHRFVTAWDDNVGREFLFCAGCHSEVARPAWMPSSAGAR